MLKTTKTHGDAVAIQMQPARHDAIFQVEGMRLMNGPGETAEQKAAREAAEADRIAAEAAKAEADRIAAEKAEADRIAAEKAAEDEERKKLEDDRKAGKLTDKEFEFLTDAMKHKAAAREAQRAAKEANDRLKAFEGVDLDAIKKLMADKEASEKAAREAELKAAQKAGDVERVKAMMAEAHKSEIEKLIAAAAAKDTALAEKDKVIDDLTVGAAFSGSEFITKELIYTPADARKLYSAHFDVVNGEIIPFDKPRGAANRSEMIDGQGRPLPFDEAMKKIIDAKPERDSLLRSKLAAGAASKTDGSIQGDTTPKTDGLRGVARIQASIRAGALQKVKKSG